MTQKLTILKSPSSLCKRYHRFSMSKSGTDGGIVIG